MSDTAYNPDTVFPPGDTLAELLEERGMSVDEAAMLADLRTVILYAIIQGEYPISPAIAQALETAFDVPASFWLNLQRNYDAWKVEHATR